MKKTLLLAAAASLVASQAFAAGIADTLLKGHLPAPDLGKLTCHDVTLNNADSKAVSIPILISKEASGATTDTPALTVGLALKADQVYGNKLVIAAQDCATDNGSLSVTTVKLQMQPYTLDGTQYLAAVIQVAPTATANPVIRTEIKAGRFQAVWQPQKDGENLAILTKQ